MARAKTRKYSPAKKQQILDTAEQEGIMAASKRYKVSTSVIYNWRSKAKKEQTVSRPRKARRAAQNPPQSPEPTRQELLDLVLELTLENHRLRGLRN